MKHSLPPADSVRGILKNAKTKTIKGPQLKWDEENIRITELQKDSKMKVDEPKTPYIHYDITKDPALQDLEELRLSPSNSSRASSRASSVSFSNRKIHYSDEWDSSDSEQEESELDEEQEEKNSKFDEMRNRHYLNEGLCVHKNQKNFWNLKNGKFVINNEFSDDESGNDSGIDDKSANDSGIDDIEYDQSCNLNDEKPVHNNK
ncbi:hypothetical protein BB561_004851 [Smittium simulii]|uniref:Protein phosphatase inhibitor 2 n=1 Tax=Smittium simulii TaxID=133385 RepID=A0A2T9YDU8_9FUNG|nr:hypothetical protein BB561_004851 [Smittium simulii]